MTNRIARWLWILCAGLFLVACAAEDEGLESFGSKEQALTAAQIRVMGFETPLADWTTNNSSPRATSTIKTQGTTSLAVKPKGYTEITSVKITAPGNAKSVATFDLRLPQTLTWGEARLIVRIPSQNQAYRDLGGAALTGRAANVFHTLSFPIPGDLRAALNSTATDVDFRIVLNVPSTTNNYLLDNLVVAGEAGTVDPADLNKLSIVVPEGENFAKYLMSSTDRTTIDDRCTLAVPSKLSRVANMGDNTLEFGAGVKAYADVKSEGAVSFLRSQAHIYGSLTAAGTIVQQNNVTIDGGVIVKPTLGTNVTEWQVNWPTSAPTNINRAPDAPNLDIAPGRYGSIHVYSRATVTFRSGTYYVDSLFMEPQAHFRINAAQGPVIFYIKTDMTTRVGLEYLAGTPGQVLFGYLGTGTVLVEEALVASIVASHGTIELRRPGSGLPHKGSFFGSNIHVFSDAKVEHLPLDWAFLCPLGDHDNDGISACYDACDNDPAKTQPGVCGCGKPETNSDTDKLPDCKDECDFDSANTHRGQCGCAGEAGTAPAGTECTDGLAEGPQVCNGAGTCGNPNDAAPEAGCTWVTLGTHAYWRCPSTTPTLAAQRCKDSEFGARLLQIDSALENAVVALTVTTPTLIGATDRTTEGEWTWEYTSTLDGKKFWTGGPSGKRYKGLYSNFASGAPVGTADCAAIDSSGKWSVVECSQSLPYLCEQPFGSSRTPGGGLTHDPLGPEDAYPHWDDTNGGDDTSEVPPDQCVPRTLSDPVFRPDYGLFLPDETVEVYDCDAVCGPDSTIPEAECRATHCAGDAAPPPPGYTGTCAEPGHAMRQLAEVVPGTCGVDDPDTTSDEEDCSSVTIGGLSTTCGTKTRCFEVHDDGNHNWFAQTCAAGCASGHPCDAATGYCIDPDQHEACDTTDGSACVGQCLSDTGCGIPVAIDEGGYVADDLPCIETRWCPDNGVYDAPLNGPNLDTHEDLDKTQLPDETSDVDPLPYSSDFDEPCSGGTCTDSCQVEAGPGCDRGSRHPWCNLDASLPDGSQTTAADVRDTRQGDRGGSDSLISFDVDPNADLDFDIEPLPFGLAKFDLAAAAAIRSVASFDLGVFSGEVEIVDLRGQLSASLCRVSTADSKMEILGADFLPSLAGDLMFDTAVDQPDLTEQCEQAIDDFVDAVDRAKKAFRDAQELVSQYKDLAEQGKTFAPSFCTTLAGAGLRPPGMPGANLTNPCAGETPKDTVNAFISYYENQAGAIASARQALADKVLNTANLASLLGISGAVPSNGFDFYASFGDILKGEETATLVSVFFFIGPIPCNLEVSSYMHYGIEGGLGANLWPQALIDGTGDFARAGAVIMPYADAGVTLFVGVGFSAGPLSLKVGLSGSITLANIQLPATASAGLAVTPEAVAVDDRPLPVDLDGLTNGAPLYPPTGFQRYNFQFVYSYGVDMTLSDILSGHIDGTVVVKFFFFKKRWSKQLIAFKGLPQIGPFNLIGGGSPAPSQWPSEPVAEDTSTWTSGYDSVPFVALTHLQAPETPLAPTGSFDDSRASQLFYDSLCTCSETAEPCIRQADCCDSSQACFADPALPGNATICSACRAYNPPSNADPEGVSESCTDDGQCCPGNVCSQTAKIRTNCVLKCEDDEYLSDFNNQLGCFCFTNALFTFFYQTQCDEWQANQGTDLNGDGVPDVIIDPTPASDWLCDEVDVPWGVCVPAPVEIPPTK